MECNTNSYEIKFKDVRSIRDFLDKLKRNLEQEKIDFNLQDDNLKKYEKSIESVSLKKNEKKSSSKEDAWKAAHNDWSYNLIEKILKYIFVVKKKELRDNKNSKDGQS